MANDVVTVKFSSEVVFTETEIPNGVTIYTGSAPVNKFQFNADGYITIPAGYLPSKDTAGRIEFIASHDNQGGTVNGMMYSDSSTNFELKERTDDYRFRPFTGNSETGIPLATPDDTVERAFSVGWQPNGSAVDFDLIIDGASVRSGSVAVPSEATAPLLFGIQPDLLSQGIIGTIRDIKIYDALVDGNLIHHWKVDEGAGVFALVDSVNPDDRSLDATLTPGTGSWVAEVSGGKSFDFDTTSGSGTDLVTYSGGTGWSAPLIPGDKPYYRYTAVNGDYHRIIGEAAVVFTEDFTGVDGTTINTHNSRWTANTDLVLSADNSLTSLGSFDDTNIDIGAVEPHTIEFSLKVTTSGVSNRAYIKARIPTSGQVQCIRCVVAISGGGLVTLLIEARKGGTEVVTSITSVDAPIETGFMDFTVVDDGNGIVFTSLNNGESISATNAQIDAADDATPYPITEFVGLGVDSNGPDTFIDNFIVTYGESIVEDMEDATLILNNCEGDYTASIYQGTKDTDTTVRTENLATGATKILVTSNAGTGEVTMLNNSVLLGTVADGTTEAFDVVAGDISWWSAAIGLIELGQGK